MTLLQQKRQSQENPSFLDVMNRFGDITEREIVENVIIIVNKNTKKCKNSIWRQFMSFWLKKKYTYRGNTGFKYSVFLFEKYSP
jgi:hypothetical protein